MYPLFWKMIGSRLVTAQHVDSRITIHFAVSHRPDVDRHEKACNDRLAQHIVYVLGSRVGLSSRKFCSWLRLVSNVT
jgi:hypothetical protein